MTGGIKSLIALSFLCGVSLWLCPEGNAKRVTRALCSAVLISAVIMPLRGFDFEGFSLNEAKLNSAQTEIVRKSAWSGEQLKALLLQKNCERYIEEKAGALGLQILYVSVDLKPDAAGAPVPYKADIGAVGSPESAGQLRSMVEENLGIPAERQDWALHEG